MVQFVSPRVELVQAPYAEDQLQSYLYSKGSSYEEMFYDHSDDDGDMLARVAGKLCYQSWKPGYNPNVTKVRHDAAEYIGNILKSGHGSVLEHINYGFIISNVSRVVTHELVRHRAGTAISQESGRYVRPTELKVVLTSNKSFPLDIEMVNFMEDIEEQYLELTKRYDWDNMSFSEKKRLTGFLRRFLPQGQASELMWTANVRALRHTIALRTSKHAEEEIRDVFFKIYKLVAKQSPLFFQDAEVKDGEVTFKYEA